MEEPTEATFEQSAEVAMAGDAGTFITEIDDKALAAAEELQRASDNAAIIADLGSA